MPVRSERIGPARFKISFAPPIPPDPKIDDPHAQALDMTRRVNEQFEGWIRERPEQWLCTKRRWPKNASVAAS